MIWFRLLKEPKEATKRTDSEPSPSREERRLTCLGAAAAVAPAEPGASRTVSGAAPPRSPPEERTARSGSRWWSWSIRSWTRRLGGAPHTGTTIRDSAPRCSAPSENPVICEPSGWRCVANGSPAHRKNVISRWNIRGVPVGFSEVS